MSFLSKLFGLPDEHEIRKSERQAIAKLLKKESIAFEAAGGYVPTSDVIRDTIKELAIQLTAEPPLDMNSLWRKVQDQSSARRLAYKQEKNKKREVQK